MASYHVAQFPEYQGNPLIEALPQISDDKSVIHKMASFPPYDREDRSLEPHIRRHLLERLKRVRQPLAIYVKVFRMVEQAMFEGYVNKNPFSPTTANWLHQLNGEGSPFVPKTGRFVPTARGMSLIGISGVGKSKMVERVLSCFQDVIYHDSYDGKAIHFKQIPWVKVQCPHDTTLTGFCKAIIRNIYTLLGEKPIFEKTIEGMISQIQGLVRQNFLGLLIIDDFQHVSISKSGGEINFISFLLNLIDEAGVPILFIANPEATRVLQKKFRISRRAEEGGYAQMSALTKEIWDKHFIKAIWRYQWTNVETPLTPELSQFLFERSKGIIDIAVRVYIEAQRLVIGSKNESISVAVLEQAYREACRLTDTGLTLLASGDPLAKTLCEDLFLIEDDREPTSEKNSSTLETPVSTASTNKFSPSVAKPVETPKSIYVNNVADFDRIQHSEFETEILEVLKRESLFSKDLNLNLVRSVANEKNKVLALSELNYIATQPLNLIADG